MTVVGGLQPRLLWYLSTLGEQPAAAFLRSVWFGDLACSGGKHLDPGFPLSLSDILARRSHPFSDDLILSIATWMVGCEIVERGEPVPWWGDRRAMGVIRDRFFGAVEPYVRNDPPQFGHSFPHLLESGDRFLEVATKNKGCGAAMRVGSLALLATDARASGLLTALTIITHLHPEAVAAAFAVWQAASCLAARRGNENALVATAVEAARDGAEVACSVREALGLSNPPFADIGAAIADAVSADDPYRNLSGDRGWTDARFVVPAAFLVRQRALRTAAPVRSVVEQSFAVGGDPDTICSIAMGLTYLTDPTGVPAEIAGIMRRHDIADIAVWATQEQPGEG